MTTGTEQEQCGDLGAGGSGNERGRFPVRTSNAFGGGLQDVRS